MRDMRATATFYQQQFEFDTSGEVVEGLIALSALAGGASMLIHQTAKSVELGQVGVKLSFAVEDVEALKASAAARGLVFCATHLAHGYAFENANDPDKNSISISSRFSALTLLSSTISH
jgi:predicted enzyme related to lactoylglutathione lyase